MARQESGTVKIEVQAPRALMHEILRTAVDAGHTYGIGYWAEEDGNTVELIERKALFPVALRFVFKDKYAIAMASGPRDPRAPPQPEELVAVIDERDIARALGRALAVGTLSEYDEKGWAEAAAQILEGNLDGPSADIIVQLAVFNEVLFG